MGGGGQDVDYKMPEVQKKMLWQSYGAGTNLLDKAMSGQPLWNVGSYGLPQMQMPDINWYQNLSPEIKQGIYQPTLDMANQLGEQFGSQGMMGSPMTGPTGAFGNALGEGVGRTYGPQAAMTAWNMTSPMYQQQYGAELGRNQNVWQANLQAQQAPWSMMPSYFGSGANLMPNPVVTQQSNPMASGIGGAAMGAMAFGNPWGALLGIPAMFAG